MRCAVNTYIGMAASTLSNRDWTNKASPYWLIPVVLVSSVCRGMILAPRVEVYNILACRLTGESQNFGTKLTAEYASRCSQSAIVQGEAARIQAAVVTIAAVLSATSTGFWAKIGDTYGRKIPLAASVFAAMMMDMGFLIVTHPPLRFLFDHGDTVIVLGAALDGAFGGLASFNGVVHAYGADASAHGSRSGIFSTLQGFVFVGLALGPLVGNVFSTLLGYRNDLEFATNMFFAGALLLSLNIAFIIFVLPESLPKADSAKRPPEIVLTSRGDQLKKFRHAILAIFSPISVFHPRRRNFGVKRGASDWSLTYVAIGIVVYLVSEGVYQVKYLYAKHAYNWSSSDLGLFMSLLWVFRGFNLLVFLPALVYYFKPKPTSTTTSPSSPSTIISHEASFDRTLILLSLLIEATSYLLIFFFTNSSSSSSSSSSALKFILLSSLTSLTSGGNPAMHSLAAVVLHQQGQQLETGKLFGALAVLGAVAHVVSPGLYAFVYGATVARYPRAIFAMAAVLLGVAAAAFGAVRVEPDGRDMGLDGEDV